MPRTTKAQNQVATKKDIDNAVDELAHATKKGFDAVDERFDSIEKDITKIKQDVSDLKQDVSGLKSDTSDLKRGQKALLNAIESNTQLLQEMRHLPAQVDRLNRTVFRAPR